MEGAQEAITVVVKVEETAVVLKKGATFVEQSQIGESLFEIGEGVRRAKAAEQLGVKL